MKQYVPLFEEFEFVANAPCGAKQIWTGEEVAQHIIDITPEEHDIPEFFISKYIIPNNFKLQKFQIKTLLDTDPSFKEYFDGNEERYPEESDHYPDLNIENEIVVFNGELLDGYSRVTELIKLGMETTCAFVHDSNNNK